MRCIRGISGMRCRIRCSKRCCATKYHEEDGHNTADQNVSKLIVHALSPLGYCGVFPAQMSALLNERVSSLPAQGSENISSSYHLPIISSEALFGKLI